MRYILTIILLFSFNLVCTPLEHRKTNHIVFYDDKREEIVNTAVKNIGVGYKNGGSSPLGFDCSGFTMYVYKNSGYKIPRNASSQYNSGRKINLRYAKPGDLVFFVINGARVTHVGIYAGNYNFIHAASSGKNVDSSSIKSRYWERRYVGTVTYFADSEVK